MRDRASRRRGFTLTEILLAVAMLGGVMVVLMNSFTTTQRYAVSGEALLNSGVLAQLVTERIKAAIGLNPRFLADIASVYGKPAVIVGTVADPTATANPNHLSLSPFFQYLFTRQAPQLGSSQNQIAISPPVGTGATATGIQPSELNSLFVNFRDYQVTVTIDDDVDLSLTGNASFAEAVKTIKVTVARSSVVAAKGSDPLAYTVTSRVTTPAESMDAAALNYIDSRFSGPTLPALYAEFFASAAASNAYFTGFPWDNGQSGRPEQILADAFMVLAGANTEGLELDNVFVPGSTIINADTAAQFIDQNIANLSAGGTYQFSSSKVQLAHIYSQKATTIFNTFKKIRQPMEDLNTAVLGPVAPPDQSLVAQCAALETVVSNGLAVLDSTTAAMGGGVAAYDAATAAMAATTSTTDPAYIAAAAAQSAAIGNLTGLQSTYYGAVDTVTSTLNGHPAVQLITLCSYLQQFFTEVDYKLVMPRPCAYDTAFPAALNGMSQVLTDHLTQAAQPNSGVTAYEHISTAQMFVEVTSARELVAGGLDGVALGTINAQSGQYTSNSQDLGNFLKPPSAVFDMPTLQARNGPFLAMWSWLKADAPRYCSVSAEFQPGGSIATFLGHLGAFGSHQKLDAGGILGTVNNIIGGGGGHGGH